MTNSSKTLIVHWSCLIAIALTLLYGCSSQNSSIQVEQSDDGWRLMVDGKPFFVKGMNWDYFPIGTNYEYNVWDESDTFIIEILDYEMSMLRSIGVNAIRVYDGIPPRWISYIHANYGIYTMINHAFGRYGVSIDGIWIAHTDYSNDAIQKQILSEIEQFVQTYKGTEGLLLYLLGNENNYGLFWEGAATENIPLTSDDVTEKQATAMYRLFNQGTVTIKQNDPSLPVAIANGDIQFLEIIKEELTEIDILGINVYRGYSFTDLYERVKFEYGKPVLLTEFGADAYNSREQREDQYCQAWYLYGNWKEIYQNAAGLGQFGNSLGGFTFQFSDGWWKYGQTTSLDVHNTEASWANGGYQCDYVTGEYNMNEEWFGIMSKHSTDHDRRYKLKPRAAYFLLQQIHAFDPYSADITPEKLITFYENISIDEAIDSSSSY